jgi:membrane-associated protease RseP (regulator of RpoE activity)
MFVVTESTPWDLRWRMFGIPVRVHPIFWLSALFLGGWQQTPQQAVLWIVVVFISVLVHEMGHALTARAFGWWPSILLFGFGGVCTYQAYGRTTGRRILVCLAGPAAGFLLAAAVLSFVLLRGGMPPLKWMEWILTDLIVVNIFWSVMNLFPVYPLDGGQVTRLLFPWISPRYGLKAAVYLSIVFAIVVAILFALMYQPFAVILFGFFAYQEITLLRGGTGLGRYP